MDALQTLAHQTATLYLDLHNPHHHLSRGLTHQCLGFPDLAAADAYRALSLLDSVVDPEGCEFHARRLRDLAAGGDARANDNDEDEDEDEDVDDKFEEITQEEYNTLIGPVYGLLVTTLVKCGCLRDAYDFCSRGLEVLASFSGLQQQDPNIKTLHSQMDIIKHAYISRRRAGGGTAPGHEDGDDDRIFVVDASILPAQGFARRVLYPWNTHEPDRKAPETLALLNERLRDVAPRCEVRATALPALHNQRSSNEGGGNEGRNGGDEEEEEGEVSIQLGLFAREDIPAGEILLREASMLTATNRLHDDLCDACNGPLPSLTTTGTGSEEGPVSCENCDDTIFCSLSCHDKAQQTYHGAVCENLEGLESIGKDIPDARDKADYLYLLLLERALAMAATQDVHPLELPEVKYIWGDFHDYVPLLPDDGDGDTTTTTTTTTEGGKLPFSFHLNILQPMRILEEMALDPYASLPLYDTWVLNTLYAKFRGTASGRLSTWDGGPELCAVHPLWCLANHSCDPNVRWEWGGEITFSVRGGEERAKWVKFGGGEAKGGGGGDTDGERYNGIRKDEEILNHYCDIGLDVKERREWAEGALGGMCLCPRCVWEST